MDHSINLTHDGTLILRIPKGFEVDKVVVEEMGTENRKKFVHMPADISDYCDELWDKAYERGKAEGQPEEVIPHRNYKYLSDYWCECGNHLGKKGEVKFCSDCGKKVKWDE